MPSLWERLRRRKVVEWGTGYLAAGWIAFEVVGQLVHTFGLNEDVERIAFVLLAAGLMATLVVAWYHGERGPQRLGGIEVTLLVSILTIGAVSAIVVRSETAIQPSVRASTGLDAVTSSIAVLPFDNFGDDEDQHFSDGISEEILNVLAQIPDLQVAARTSSFAYREGTAEIPEIAQSLGVAYVLEGSVRRSSATVRITAQLIAGATGFHVWSKTYDRERTPSNLFEIQDEIARIVARELQLRVSTSIVGAARFQTLDPQAHDLYLRGLAAFAQGTGDALHEALSLFQRAGERDEGYALAHARTSLTYQYLADAYLPGAEAYPLGLEAANRALRLAPDLPQALAARGIHRMSYYPWAMEKGYADSKRALEISPSVPWAHFGIAIYGWWRGSPEGCSDLDNARRVDPLNPLFPFFQGFCSSLMGRHAEAVAAQEVADRLDPDFLYIDGYVGLSYAALGRHEDALAQFERAERIRGGPSAGYAIYLADQGHAEKARAKLEAIERASATGEIFPPELLAIGWAVLGDDERAFRALEHGMRIRSAGALVMSSAHRIRRLTSTPRYRELAARYGLPLPPRTP